VDEPTSPDQEAAEGRDEFDSRVMSNIYDVFWAPEIERRGGLGVTGPLVAALAVLPPGGPVRVLLNEEVELVARARTRSAIDPGTTLTLDNVGELDRIEPR
jgi:hypothetical protein